MTYLAETVIDSGNKKIMCKTHTKYWIMRKRKIKTQPLRICL